MASLFAFTTHSVLRRSSHVTAYGAAERSGRSNVASRRPLAISIFATCPLPNSATQRCPALSRDMRRGPVPSLNGSRCLILFVRVSTHPTEPLTCEYQAQPPSGDNTVE